MMTAAAALKTPALLVATDLATVAGEDVAGTAQTDVTIDGRAYRPLDATYYAWLRRRMESARRAHEAGRLAGETWAELRERFNAVHAWALAHLEPRALLAAAEAPTPEGFAPPVPTVVGPPPPHHYPAEGAFRFEVAVPSEAAAEVLRARDEALAAGWSEAELLQNRGSFRFPCGPDWGLVCFLGPDRRVGAVTADRIELVSRVPGRPPLGFCRRSRSTAARGGKAPAPSDRSRAAPVCVG
jgi:hypothetical protein